MGSNPKYGCEFDSQGNQELIKCISNKSLWIHVWQINSSNIRYVANSNDFWKIMKTKHFFSLIIWLNISYWERMRKIKSRYVKAFELNFPYLGHLATVLTHMCDSCVHELTRDLFLSHISPTGRRSGAVKFTSVCVRDRQAGCLKVIMTFNLSQRWFIWAWLASQTTDLKAWNENYYLGSLISHFEFSESGKENENWRLYIQYLRWIWFNSSEVWSSVDLTINVNDQKKSYI